MIDADDANGDGIPTLQFELADLLLQITDDPADLSDHCLLNNLDLNADLDCRYRPAFHDVAGH